MANSKPRQLIKTVAAAGTAERIGSLGDLFRQAILTPYYVSGGTLTVNTQPVYVGVSSAAGEQTLKVGVTDQITITVPDGKVLDWYDFFLDATVSGEGITILFW